jgi:hypothetical protein
MEERRDLQQQTTHDVLCCSFALLLCNFDVLLLRFCSASLSLLFLLAILENEITKGEDRLQ